MTSTQAGTAAPRPPAESSLTRVVIAEDDASLREALCDLISAQPHLELIGSAGGADEVIRLAADAHPDVILLDVRMPGGGGVRAAREIRRYAPLARVVALSAHSDRETVTQMLGAGAVGFIVKGSRAQEILAAINQAIRGETTLSPEVAAVIRTPGVEAPQRRSAAAAFRRVLEGDGFSVVFQPICDLAAGRVIGVEALSRFEVTPPRGPAEVFAEAEQVGMRTELEVMAMRAALAEADEHGPGIFVSVNLSPSTLISPLFVESVPASAHHLVVEVTEEAAVADPALLETALRTLRMRGGQMAIDNVGASFATLRQLLSLSPDYIKLDMALTRNIASDRGARALAFGITAFALELGAVIIASGIETEEEVKALRSIGVTYGQGYQLGWPGAWPTD